MLKTFTFTFDTSIITPVELLKLARETQLKITSKASTKYFKCNNPKKMDAVRVDYVNKSYKLEYIDYLIKKLEDEEK